MLTAREILFSTDLTRSQRLLWRVGLPLGVTAALATAVVYSDEIHDTIIHDYGCATTEVDAGSNVKNAALNARPALGLPVTNGKLDETIAQAVPLTPDQAENIQPGTLVTTCVGYNLLSLGSAGWNAEVTVAAS